MDDKPTLDETLTLLIALLVVLCIVGAACAVILGIAALIVAIVR